MSVIERCAKALMASYWGWSAENMEAEWPELGDADQERARHAARACLQASGAVERAEKAENVAESWRRLADDNGAEAMRRARELRGAVEALCKIAAHDPPMGFVRQRQIAAEALEAMGVDSATCGGQ